MTEAKEEYRLACLRSLLERPRWSYGEAALALAGVDPSEHRPGDHAPGQWPLLPGIPWPRDVDGHASLDAQLRESISQIQSGLARRSSTDQAPAAFVAWAIAAKPRFDPPWLAAAREDALCSPLLPVPARRTSRAIVNQRSAELRWANDPRQIVIETEGRKLFEKLRAEGFRDLTKPGGTPNISKIADALHAKLQRTHGAVLDAPAIKAHVRRWLK